MTFHMQGLSGVGTLCKCLGGYACVSILHTCQQHIWEQIASQPVSLESSQRSAFLSSRNG